MLDALMEASAEQAKRRQAATSESLLEAAIENAIEKNDPDPDKLGRALRKDAGISVIAEHKRRSPVTGKLSRGRHVFDVVSDYTRGKAAAISIVTEEASFEGNVTDLWEARESTGLPILQKDFISTSYQLHEARSFGADSVLLITAALDDRALQELTAEADGLRLGTVFEVHDREELDRALELGADVIGINNRNLDDFSVRLETTFELVGAVPDGVVTISESGIERPAQLKELELAGVDAVLVGESLMRAENPAKKIRELREKGLN